MLYAAELNFVGSISEDTNMLKNIVIFLALAISILSCGHQQNSTSPSNQSGTGSLTLALQWKALARAKGILRAPPVGVATIRISISGAGMTTIQQDFSASSPSGQINAIPAGTNRTISAQGLDAGGTVTHTGSISGITINVGQTTDAGTLVMNLLDIDSGLVAHYPFNGNADDVSGNGYHGTVSGALPATDRFGNANGAYSFDGVNDIITTNQEKFAVDNKVSVSLWVNSNTIGLQYFMMCSDFGVSTKTNEVDLAISLPNTNSASGAIVNGEWYHFAGTYDGTYIRAYVNGQFASETYHPGNIYDPHRTLKFGTFGDGVDYWAGMLDDVRIYNRILSDAEVQMLYSLQSYSVSGMVTSSGTGLSGVTMTLSGAGSGSATTGASGSYSFSALVNGTYTLTPSKSGYTFSPTSTAVTVNGSNQTGKNFTATPIVTTYLVSGMVTSSGVGLSGVTMTLSGDGSGSATTVSNGTYTISSVANGAYTITPSKSGYTFSPTSAAVSVSGANVTGKNFTAAVATYGPTTVPDTGQTGDYTATFGEDSDYTINPPSYTDNGNGTVTDNVTGLVWQKQDDATPRTWDAAITYCSGNAAGLPGTGWRLPTDFELTTIVDYGRSYPAIDPVFIGTQSSYYWSSTTYVNDSTYAWYVNFYYGVVRYNGKTISYYVRCVR